MIPIDPDSYDSHDSQMTVALSQSLPFWLNARSTFAYWRSRLGDGTKNTFTSTVTDWLFKTNNNKNNWHVLFCMTQCKGRRWRTATDAQPRLWRARRRCRRCRRRISVRLATCPAPTGRWAFRATTVNHSFHDELAHRATLDVTNFFSVFFKFFFSIFWRLMTDFESAFDDLWSR